MCVGDCWCGSPSFPVSFEVFCETRALDVCVRGPTAQVGGESTMDLLEVQENAVARYPMLGFLGACNRQVQLGDTV